MAARAFGIGAVDRTGAAVSVRAAAARVRLHAITAPASQTALALSFSARTCASARFFKSA